MKLEAGKYTITELEPGITWLYDGINDSIYVDETEEAAWVIDTGMAPGCLMEELRKVTEKPLTLVVTHGHLDHVMKAAEFDSFYMSSLDDRLVTAEANVDFSRRIHIADGDILRIKGSELHVVALPGHTAGSVLYVNQKKKIVYDGDAMCNGRNVWLQLPGCSKLSDYADSLEQAMAKLKKLGVDETWNFLSGHYEQRFQSRVCSLADNAPNLQMMEDSITLCRKLVSGELTGEIETMDKSMGDQAYHAHYGKAEMLYTLKQL